MRIFFFVTVLMIVLKAGWFLRVSTKMPSGLLILMSLAFLIDHACLVAINSLILILGVLWAYRRFSWNSDLLILRQVDINLNLSGGILESLWQINIGFNILFEFILCCRLNISSFFDFLLISFYFCVIHLRVLSYCRSFRTRLLLWVSIGGDFMHD